MGKVGKRRGEEGRRRRRKEVAMEEEDAASTTGCWIRLPSLGGGCMSSRSKIVSVPEKGARKHPRGDNIQIDTKDILFICGGAFVDLEKTISERRQDSSIGFGAPVRANMRAGGISSAQVTSTLLESVESGDLIAYGLILEFIGRFPILVGLAALNEDQLIQILTWLANLALERRSFMAIGDGAGSEVDAEAELSSSRAMGM